MTDISRIPADLEWTAANGAHERLPIGRIIREQAAEIERLRAALSPFARHAHCTNEIQPSSLALWCAQALNALSDVDQQGPQEPK